MVKSGGKWGKVGKSGEKLKSGKKWGKAVKSGEKLEKVVKSGEKWLARVLMFFVDSMYRLEIKLYLIFMELSRSTNMKN